MQTKCSAELFGFARVEGREVMAAFDGGIDLRRRRAAAGCHRSGDRPDAAICHVFSRYPQPDFGRA